jgi:hypothetical protein
MISFFINDLSVHGQFSRHQFYTALNSFLDLLEAVNKLESQYRIVLCQNFYYCQAIPNENLRTSIKKDKDLNLRFASVFQRTSFDYWNTRPVQDSNLQYFFKGIDYVNTTIGEATEVEHKKIYNHCSLLNFENSSIFDSAASITVTRGVNQAATQITIRVHRSEKLFMQWVSVAGIKYPKARLFEHNSKHHLNVREDGNVSSLESSLDDAQALLDGSISEDGISSKKLFNYDQKIQKYVIFRKHETNKYHGYNEDELNKIPNNIRNHFGV